MKGKHNLAPKLIVSACVPVAARDVALRRELAVAVGSYWTIAWERLTAAGAGRIGHLPGHAGIFETGMIAAIRPDLVREPRPARAVDERTSPPMPADPYRFEVHGFWQSIDGYSDSPALYLFTVGVRQRPGNHGGLPVRGAPRGRDALAPGEG